MIAFGKLAHSLVGVLAFALMATGFALADEPTIPDLSDLRAAVNTASKRGDNVLQVAKALDVLEKRVAKGWAFPAQGRTVTPPAELLAVREAIEMAKCKGENADGILKELELVEKSMTGQVQALVKEIPPNPLPEAKAKVVRVWEYQNANGKVGTISGTDGGDWIEKRPAGEPQSSFKFIRRTERFTELYDKHRNFTMNLFDNGESEWSVGGPWNRWLKGKWLEEKKP